MADSQPIRLGQEKKCAHCRKTKPASDFKPSRKTKDGLSCCCRVCIPKHRRNTRKWKRAHVERSRDSARRTYHRHPEYKETHALREWHRCLKAKYGIDANEYQRMLFFQGGTCAICGTTKPGKHYKRMPVDHCHKTGKVRGLLCADCNAMLGIAHESPEVLRKAARYLEENRNG
jgi:hypothetical protein